MLKVFGKSSIPKTYNNLVSKGFIPFWILVAVSLFLHFSAVVKLGSAGRVRLGQKDNDRVKIRVVDMPKKKTMEGKKILEAKQEKTEKPENAKYKGAQDHKTDKETKAKPTVQDKALDPGLAGNAQITKSLQKPKPKSQAKKKSDSKDKTKPKQLLTSETGTVSLPSRKPRNKYEELMPNNNDLAAMVKSGYQDYLDEALEEGDRIDINTTDYRYIGYFTSLRKAVELVWTYPREAVRRGLQGEVGVEFTILKDGTVKKVKVIKSSGHKVLDSSVVEAIKLASPYTPLPDGIDKKKLVIVGGFRYVLSNFGGRTAR